MPKAKSIEMKKIIVAIDGFSSTGKSTIAKELAKEVGYVYIDTGAMYRAVALYSKKRGWITDSSIAEKELEKEIGNISIEFKTNAEGISETFLDGKNVEKEIRSLNLADAASRISTLAFVRRELVRRQQEMGKKKAVVMDGRDIGTVVFPNAELKLFVTASPRVRANRRLLELQTKGENVTFEEVFANVTERDKRDLNRKESPLKKATDAIEIDNSDLSHAEQKEIVMNLFLEKTQ